MKTNFLDVRYPLLRKIDLNYQDVIGIINKFKEIKGRYLGICKDVVTIVYMLAKFNIRNATLWHLCHNIDGTTTKASYSIHTVALSLSDVQRCSKSGTIAKTTPLVGVTSTYFPWRFWACKINVSSIAKCQIQRKMPSSYSFRTVYFKNVGPVKCHI